MHNTSAGRNGESQLVKYRTCLLGNRPDPYKDEEVSVDDIE